MGIFRRLSIRCQFCFVFLTVSGSVYFVPTVFFVFYIFLSAHSFLIVLFLELHKIQIYIKECIIGCLSTKYNFKPV